MTRNGLDASPRGLFRWRKFDHVASASDALCRPREHQGSLSERAPAGGRNGCLVRNFRTCLDSPARAVPSPSGLETASAVAQSTFDLTSSQASSALKLLPIGVPMRWRSTPGHHSGLRARHDVNRTSPLTEPAELRGALLPRDARPNQTLDRSLLTQLSKISTRAFASSTDNIGKTAAIAWRPHFTVRLRLG